MIDTQSLASGFANAVARSGGPGGVAYVGDSANEYFHRAFGNQQSTPAKIPANRETIYDLASLTKVVATTTCTMKLVEAGQISLDARATDYVPFPWCGDMRVRHLITHTAGFTAGKYRYKDHNNLLDMVKDYTQSGIVAPPGTRYTYSDIGFMLLGLVVEAAGGDTLDAVANRMIFAPLGMMDTGFNPPDDKKPRCAATEKCAWRQEVVQGVVHDENAFAAGGVSGHAGLFSTAADLAKFCRALLAGELVSESTLDEMLTFGRVPKYPWQGYGWKLDPRLSDSLGALPSRNAFGHTGWTGTSMYLDRGKGLFAIELGNTCHPSRTKRSNRSFRQNFYAPIAKSAYPDRRGVHTGLDRMKRDGFRPVDDKRYALLTNTAAVDQLENPILNVFGDIGGKPPHIIYSPEHGFARQGEAGEKISSQMGNVPIVSLYGDRSAPTPEELQEVKLFIVDLQDIGSRYYTYMHTMRKCIEACAAAKVHVLVLDRPNPLGGTIIEGPLPTVIGSPVCTAKMPIRHGMTMGELAYFFGDQLDRKPQIDVHMLDNWIPSLQFDDCSLPWIPPSPNMPTPDTALAYVGTCLLEGLNLNEGRGTPYPFLLFGAPWFKAEDVMGRLDPTATKGARLEIERYTPVSIEGKSTNPRYKDEQCRGIHLYITDRDAFRPFTFALELIHATHKIHGDRLEFSTFFDTLAGGPLLRERIVRGDKTEFIIEYVDAANRAFDNIRPKMYTGDAMG